MLAALVACARVSQETTSASEAGLIPSLNVRVDGDSVHMTLHLTSALEAPVDLEFSSGQRFDFQVRRAGGPVVWTWAADKLFTQALGTERLEAGQTLTWHATWAGAPAGAYEATGRVVSTNRPMAITVPFEVR
jgi:hypothetical protein